MTSSLTVGVADDDIIKMVEEYLSSRRLDISLMCLERETGVVNGAYSDDGLFLRQLILDGQWDDALEFLEPLENQTHNGFDSRTCKYLIYKHKYLEQLCIKQDPGPLQNHEFTLDEVVSCLTALEDLCPSRKEYDNLCFLLTLPSLSSDPHYSHWNPSSARYSCFREIYPLVKKFVGCQKKSSKPRASKNDRLVNLIVKGLLYEMCVDLCTARACGAGDSAEFNHPLSGAPCCDADLSLVSWLQKVPSGMFACPFEKRSLKVKLESLQKPSLEAVWSEQLLVPPIRPKLFPHNAIPSRTRASQLVSQSMMAAYDGLSSDLAQHAMVGSSSEPRTRGGHLSRSFAAPLSKFLLTNSLRADRKNNPMNQSVERLFSGGESPRLRGESPLAKEKTATNTLISPPAQFSANNSIETSLQTPHSSFNSSPTPSTTSTTVTANQRSTTTPTKTTHDNAIITAVTTHDSTGQRDFATSRHDVTPIRAAATSPPRDISTPLSIDTRIPSSMPQSNGLPQTTHKSVTGRPQGRSEVSDSQGDLYAAYREQKLRIEEKLRQTEERDAEWKQLEANARPTGRVDNPGTTVPQLNLDQSESSLTPANLSAEEVGRANDEEAEIKQFVAVETLEEQGPVRAVAFHPDGHCYAVGSNTKVLRVCQFPDVSKVTTNYHGTARKPKVLAKKVKHHMGSIFSVAWNTMGTVIATGSNDHTIKCVQWIDEQNVYGAEKELSVHDGTIRDVAFLTNEHLLSGGAGDCSICLSDVATGAVVRRYKGHTGHVLALYPHTESQKFVSGGQDRKALFWDVRMSVPVHTYCSEGGKDGPAFASVCLDPMLRVLASGHDNSHCSLYDLRQGRLLQTWRPHTDEVRSVRFNADATYFLSGSYDTTVKLMDMQGDITQPLKTVQVAEHSDKVISSRWHPVLPSFITSSADKTVTCWAIQIDP